MAPEGLCLPDHVPPNGQNLLTCIPRAYTLASHTEADSANEADRLMIRHFQETLAEIALSVASRTVKQ